MTFYCDTIKGIMKKRVFFLGAGFSKLAGFPLMSNFYNVVKDFERSENSKGSLYGNFNKEGFSQCYAKLKALGLHEAPFSDGFSVLHTLARRGNTQFHQALQVCPVCLGMPDVLRNTGDQLQFHQALNYMVQLFIAKQ